MELLRFFADYKEITAYFTTRNGGVSTNEFSSLNLGYNTNDDKNIVDINRKLVKQHLCLENTTEFIIDQVHKTDVAVICDVEYKKGEQVFLGEYDAIITNQRNLLITTGYADCIPILLYDQVQRVIGLSHCGWKGTVYKCVEKTIEKMTQVYGTKASDIIAGIGAGIGFCCFETDKRVYDIFVEEFPYISDFSKEYGTDKFLIDLKGLNQKILENCGVKTIEINSPCTACNTDAFFSYRKENGNTGRMTSGIVLL